MTNPTTDKRKERLPLVNLEVGTKVKLNFGDVKPFWSSEKSFGYNVSEGVESKVLFAPKRLNEMLLEHFEQGKKDLEIEVGDWQGYRAYKVN